MSRPYQPPRRVPRSALALLVGAAVGTSVVGGATLLTLSLLPLPLLAATAVGLLIGLVLAAVLRRARLARPAIATGAAATTVACAFALQLGVGYARFRADVMSERATITGTWRELGMIPAADDLAHLESGPGAYLAQRYAIGHRALPEGRGATLGPVGAVFFDALELAIALWIAIALARAQAREPACPVCGAWRVERLLGHSAHGRAAQLIGALGADRVEAAAQLLEPPDTRERIDLALLTCPRGHDGERGVVRVVDRPRDRKGRLRYLRLGDFELDNEELALLRRGFEHEQRAS